MKAYNKVYVIHFTSLFTISIHNFNFYKLITSAVPDSSEFTRFKSQTNISVMRTYVLKNHI